jgi:hypothetical protein
MNAHVYINTSKQETLWDVDSGKASTNWLHCTGNPTVSGELRSSDYCTIPRNSDVFRDHSYTVLYSDLAST